MYCTAISCQTQQFYVGKSNKSDSFQELWDILHTVKSFHFVAFKFRGFEFNDEFVDI